MPAAARSSWVRCGRGSWRGLPDSSLGTSTDESPHSTRESPQMVRAQSPARSLDFELHENAPLGILRRRRRSGGRVGPERCDMRAPALSCRWRPIEKLRRLSTHPTISRYISCNCPRSLSKTSNLELLSKHTKHRNCTITGRTGKTKQNKAKQSRTEQNRTNIFANGAECMQNQIVSSTRVAEWKKAKVNKEKQRALVEVPVESYRRDAPHRY